VKEDDCRPSGAQEVFRHKFMGYVLSVTAFLYVNSSPVHSAATEGPGVLIHIDNLPQVKPQ
jgi:hypothetical protein